MNNPSAFPRPLNADTEGRQGMTLRDYFAAAALRGFSANPRFVDAAYDKVAEAAFVQAEAMMKVRDQ